MEDSDRSLLSYLDILEYVETVHVFLVDTAFCPDDTAVALGFGILDCFQLIKELFVNNFEIETEYFITFHEIAESTDFLQC